MPYDESLADRVRALVIHRDGYSERKMFGGLCFMVHGNMFAGVIRDELMFRVGKDAFDDALKRPGTRPMDFTGRPSAGTVFVDAKAIASDDALQGWLDDALSFVETIPPQTAKARALRPPPPSTGRGPGGGVHPVVTGTATASVRGVRSDSTSGIASIGPSARNTNARR
jgi:TfoX/Sxy family transcriptional regulator of competence genes